MRAITNLTRCFGLAACVALAAFVAPVAMAGDAYTSPKGFSLTPPDGWKIADKTLNAEVGDVAKKQFPALASADFDKMAVMILNPDDEGKSNINVVVNPGALPIDQPGIEDELSSALSAQYKQMGVDVSHLTVTHKTFGTTKTLFVEYDMNISGASMHQWQIFEVTSDKMFIVTCTAPVDKFKDVAPVFTKVIESMKVGDAAAKPDAGK